MIHNYDSNILKIRSLGIDTYRENVIYMRADCHVCLSEGYTALTRLAVYAGEHRVVATLNVIHSPLLNNDEAALSMEAQARLNVNEGDFIRIEHLKTIESLAYVRRKLYGRELTEQQFKAIIADVVEGNFSNIELASFISSCSGDNMTRNEIIGLTRAMISVGHKIKWDKKVVMDKHCVGGLPGNRTTPIVISIVAAAGLTVPKTSSRAITSPAGTADTMETMTRVNLTLEEIKKVVNTENACLAWGGAVKLSPADDVIISVEKALDIDSEGQMIASVLSKKIAAGATHVVIDIPVGVTAKIRSHEQALKLESDFKAVGMAIGLQVEIVITDGSQPVGFGIGPALEAMDVLSVLRNESNAPDDLKARSLKLAGVLLEISKKSEPGKGISDAEKILLSGEAFRKFEAICRAQGEFKIPVPANYSYNVFSEIDGTVIEIDNRRLAKLAKLAGAPKTPGAGISFKSRLGRKVKKGDLLFTIYSGFPGELQYALDYFETNKNILLIK
jgi:thymidine phosphorylase